MSNIKKYLKNNYNLTNVSEEEILATISLLNGTEKYYQLGYKITPNVKPPKITENDILNIKFI